jgi:ERCC4-related helicase
MQSRSFREPKAPSVAPNHSDSPTLKPHYGTLKALCTPGTWRRGFTLYRQGQVKELSLTPLGVAAKVKGNYKDFYTTQIAFQPEGLQPTCNCPLETPWCKHAIGVALASLDQGLWESYWGIEALRHTPELSYQFDTASNFQFMLDPFRQPNKTFGIKVYDRISQSVLRKPEVVLKHALNERGPDGKPIQFTVAQRAEFALLQFLVKQGFTNNNERQGFFQLPIELAQGCLNLLANAPEVVDKFGNPLFFTKEALKLKLDIFPSGSTLSVGLHWERWADKQLAQLIPFEDMALINRDASWGLYQNILYPLASPVGLLPKALTKTTFTDVSEADAGRFMHELVPKLKQRFDVNDGELSDQQKTLKVSPRPHLIVELVDASALRLRVTLNYLYLDTKVPFTLQIPDNPYVMASSKRREGLNWVQRDFLKESQAFQRLNESSLVLMQANQFQADGDSAIEVYNSLLKKLEKEGWVIHKVNEANMKVLKASDQPLQLRLRIEFDETTISHFLVKPSCAVGKADYDLDQVQDYLISGKRYFFMNGVGFVEVPLAKVLQFNRTVQALDAETIENGTILRVPAYKIGLIAEFVDFGVKLNMSRKFKKFWDVMSAGKSMDEYQPSQHVQAELRPYQLRGFHWLWFLYTYGLNGILADDMGLGKTLQALVMLQQARDVHGSKPSLIVCPTSVVYNWQKEIQKFTPTLKVLDLTGSNRFEKYKQLNDFDIVVTSYAILRRDINALKDYKFRFAILDESQHIKNADSLTAQAAKSLDARNRLALSGTPIENKLSELWSVFDFLMPDFLEEAHEFRRRYIVPIEERGNQDAERRLKKQVFPFILRRMKRDVLKDLPPKLELVQYCDMTDDQYDLYMKVLEKTRDEILQEAMERGGKMNHNTILTALTRLRQVCNHSSLVGNEMSEGLHESGKFEALKEMLTSAIENGHRILVFSQFVEMLKIVKQWLVQQGIKHEMLTGQTKNRQEVVERFNEDDSIPVFLVSLKAGGTGLNLTGADFVIHYDPWWNPAAEDQATDRVHRIGQDKNVFVYRLITRGTVEEKIMRLKDRKRDLVDSIIAADRTLGKQLTLDDLKDILSTDNL